MANRSEYDKSIVRDLKVYKQNRLNAHSAQRYFPGTRTVFPGAEELLEPQKDYEYYQSLNGVWKVHVSQNEEGIPEGFYENSYDINEEERLFFDIKVPAHIQIEGFDHNAYVNYQYPWDGVEAVVPGQIPSEYNPVACYVNYFDINNYSEDLRYHIVFEGVESNIALFINGRYVGYAEDSFTQSEFDITDFIKESGNRLACIVYKWCSSCFIDDQDFFRFSGIFRNVSVRAYGEAHIEDIFVHTDLDSKYRNATLKIDIKLDENADNCNLIHYALCRNDTTVEFSGITDDQKGYFTADIIDGGIIACGDIRYNKEDGKAVSAAAEIEAPKLWSAESPDLYILHIALLKANFDEENVPTSVELIETSSVRVGFRKFEMIDGIMCLNGKRIVFNGVNRHEFSMTNGRAISYEETKQDIINMKRNNINALRTSHYPNNEFVYDLCDEYGLYVICENNMESHGSWSNIYMGMTSPDKIVPGDDPDFTEIIIDRAESMIEKEKNHPSIVIWSCGNESFGGSSIYKLSQHMRKLDSSRLIHYEGIFHDRRYPDTSDMESQMYPSVEAIEEFLRKDHSKPFICCEYTHAMGNSCGAMNKYTELSLREPRYQGGFIWDYIDQAVETENIFGEKYLGYGGDFSDRPCDYEFSGDGICYADRTDSPKMPAVKYNYQPAAFRVVDGYMGGGASLRESEHYIYVRNLHLFTDFTIYDFELVYAVNGEITGEGKVTDKVKNLKPGEESFVEINYESNTRRYLDEPGVYTATLYIKYKEDNRYARKGEVAAFFQHQRVITVIPQDSGKGSSAIEGVNYGLLGEIPEICDRVERDLYREGSIKEKAPYTAAEKAAFRIIEGGYNVGVRGEKFSVLFSGINGGMTSYVYDGKEYIDAIPRPNFWRAPTDNDRGNQMPFRYAVWKAASNYQMFKNPESDQVASYPLKLEKYENRAEISYVYYLPTGNGDNVNVVYSVFPDGKIRVNMHYVYGEGSSDMPEFGMLIKLPHDLKNLKWFGLGPQETYADRTQGAMLGWYSNKVEENFARYLRPQECGNKMGVFEAELTNDEGRGVKFNGISLNFSALPYTPDEIECALHPYELKRSDHTVVRVSLMQMGVGGDDTWGARTHEEFLLPKKNLDFEFSFKGI